MECGDVLEALSVSEAPSPALREHLADCADCREAEGTYARLKGRLRQAVKAPPEYVDRRILALGRPPAKWAWRAAAAVLIAAGLAAYLGSREPPASPRSEPSPAVHSQPVSVQVLPGASLVADAGADLRSLSESRMELRQGRLLIHAGRAFTVATPFGECSASEAVFEVVCAGPAASASFFRSAWAAEERGEILVVRGEATWTAGGEAIRVGAGQLLKVDGGKASLSSLDAAALEARLAWRDGNAPWQDLEGPLSLRSGGREPHRVRRELPSCARFVWTATFRRPGEGYLDVLLPKPMADGEVLTLGELPQLADGKEHVLTLRWDLAPVLLLDGAVLREFRPGAGRPQAGLGVTNGVVEISHWQWRLLP